MYVILRNTIIMWSLLRYKIVKINIFFLNGQKYIKKYKFYCLKVLSTMIFHRVSTIWKLCDFEHFEIVSYFLSSSIISHWNTYIITWSKGHCLRCKLAKQARHMVWPQPSDMGPRIATSKSWQQIGHDRNSVHCGACIGIL